MAMNANLRNAVERISKLSDQEQAKFAALIEEELDDDQRWDEAFARSLPQLELLAEEARQEYRAGLTEPLDPDNL